LVKIEVGTGDNRREFLIHKKLLSEKVAVFDKLFNGGFMEAVTQSTNSSGGRPKGFRVVRRMTLLWEDRYPDC
jgi:hypothetical protein